MYLLHQSDCYLCRKGPRVALITKRSANHITFSKIHELITIQLQKKDDERLNLFSGFCWIC